MMARLVSMYFILSYLKIFIVSSKRSRRLYLYGIGSSGYKSGVIERYFTIWEVDMEEK